MIERSFVDTNIFIYARNSGDTGKQRRAMDLIASLRKENVLIISAQVVTEFASVMSNKLKAPQDKVLQDLDLLLNLDPNPIDSATLQLGIQLQGQYSLSWWDSWIVASAIQSGCKTIYSEDLSNGASYHGTTVVNPFLGAQTFSPL